MGLQRETAGRGVIAVYGQVRTSAVIALLEGSMTDTGANFAQIVFATALELIVFHTAPPALSVLGTVIIVSSALYVAVRPISCVCLHRC